MNQTPCHKAAENLPQKLELRIISPDSGLNPPKTYAHCDDYYIFGIIDHGSARIECDFREITLGQGELMFVKPWQIHRFISSRKLHARIMLADSSLISDRSSMIFEDASLHGFSIRATTETLKELSQLFDIIRSHTDSPPLTESIGKAFTDLFADTLVIDHTDTPGVSQRQRQHYLLFRKALTMHIRSNRSPSYYANLLSLSPVYLNEIVRRISGMSVTGNIQTEIVLQAKRMLAYSDMTVKEISCALGFDDSSYFNRLFRQISGTTPAKFRQNLESSGSNLNPSIDSR